MTFFNLFSSPLSHHPAEEEGDSAAWWAGGVQPSLTIYIVNNGYQTNLMSQITGSSTAGKEFCVSCMLSLQKQRNQNAQENDESVFCYKQYFSSVECKDSESLCLKAQLEALITSMGQKVSS